MNCNCKFFFFIAASFVVYKIMRRIVNLYNNRKIANESITRIASTRKKLTKIDFIHILKKKKKEISKINNQKNINNSLVYFVLLIRSIFF